MQPFKIGHYESIHGPGTFPPVRRLTDHEAESIRESLRKQLHLSDDVSPIDMLQAISDASLVVPDADAKHEGFDLSRVLTQFGCDVSGSAYLNWYHFANIDEMLTRDVIVNFSDIWYPAADDLELIDSRFRWIVSVHHEGSVLLLNLAGAT
jgi:hypothetical protein